MCAAPLTCRSDQPSRSARSRRSARREPLAKTFHGAGPAWHESLLRMHGLRSEEASVVAIHAGLTGRRPPVNSAASTHQLHTSGVRLPFQQTTCSLGLARAGSPFCSPPLRSELRPRCSRRRTGSGHALSMKAGFCVRTRRVNLKLEDLDILDVKGDSGIDSSQQLTSSGSSGCKTT